MTAGNHGAGCTCGCCAGVADRTPQAIENRPGLSAIAYRAGTHGDFLASMLAGLTDDQRHGIRRLTTRDPDDFTIGLLDAWAVTSDVLTFYTERLAQESFLRTARDRTSLQELGRLIGYQLRPGVAAEAAVAFALEPPPAAPPNVIAEPGSLPPATPPVVSIPVGLRVQSIPGPGEQPQTFETIEAVEARPEWGAIPASTTITGIEPTNAWLAGTGLNLKVGDLLLWTDGASDELRYITSVSPDLVGARTRVTWTNALGVFATGSTPAAFVFRKQLAVFGHNAPQWKAMSQEFRDNYDEPGSTITEWPDLDVNLATICCVHVDGSHPDVTVGSKIVIRVGDTTGVWVVGWNSEGSEAEFAVSGKVTHLIAEGPTSLGVRSRRDIVVYAAPEQLTLAQRDDPSDVGEDRVEIDQLAAAPAAGRRLIITGQSTAGAAVVHITALASVDFAPGGRWTLRLDEALATPLARSTVVVHANVALTTHGETVGELLGSGRAGHGHQRFALKSAPLTHVQSSDPSGASPALVVRVNDVAWDEVPTLYGAGPNDRSYVLRIDEDDHTNVQFGDGERGARLPTGEQNVRARYRKGLGVAGNVGPGQLSTLLDRPLGLKGASNPAGATGGVDPESPAVARSAIPLTVRTLGRAVSVLDYEDFARSFAGVSKASASVLSLRAGPTIVVTVAFGELGTDPPGDRLHDLETALIDHGDPHAAVEVLDHTRRPFRLAMKVAVDPAYEVPVVLGEVDAAIRWAFAFPSRRFAATVERSLVVSIAHSVPGVVAVDLDRLYDDASHGLKVRLVAPSASVTSSGAASPAGILVADESPFDWLEALT